VTIFPVHETVSRRRSDLFHGIAQLRLPRDQISVSLRLLAIRLINHAFTSFSSHPTARALILNALGKSTRHAFDPPGLVGDSGDLMEIPAHRAGGVPQLGIVWPQPDVDASTSSDRFDSKHSGIARRRHTNQADD